MRKKKCLNILAVVGAILLLCWATSFGFVSAAETQSSEEEETTVIGPRTDKLLRAMGDYLKTAKQFSFHAEITFDDMPLLVRLQHKHPLVMLTGQA